MPMSPGERPILVVDDDSDLRDAIRESLELEGYLVVDKSNGLDALRYLRARGNPFLILLDWNMSPINAPQFMKALMAESDLARIPVVLITADAHASMKAAMADFVDYVMKPLKLERLIAIVERYASVP